MSHSYVHNPVHLVFSTKERRKLVRAEAQPRLRRSFVVCTTYPRLRRGLPCDCASGACRYGISGSWVAERFSTL